MCGFIFFDHLHIVAADFRLACVEFLQNWMIEGAWFATANTVCSFANKNECVMSWVMFVIYYVWHHVKLVHEIESISSKNLPLPKTIWIHNTTDEKKPRTTIESTCKLQVKTSQKKSKSNQKSYDHVYSRASIAAGSFINEGWIENAKEITQHFAEIRNNK